MKCFDSRGVVGVSLKIDWPSLIYSTLRIACCLLIHLSFDSLHPPHIIKQALHLVDYISNSLVVVRTHTSSLLPYVQST